MSIAGASSAPSARKKSPHRIIIARGDNVRAFSVRPWIAGSVLLACAAFGVLYLAATAYLIFRDDILAASFARQARQQQAYEDRIALLRADIDRLTSRQLLNQEAFEARLARLAGKQAALDARQDIIASLSQAAKSAGLLPAGDPAPVPLPRPAPDRAAALDGAPAPAGLRASLAVAHLRSATDAGGAAAGSPGDRIEEVATALEDLARDQVAYVETIAAAVGDKAAKIEAVLKDLGHAPKSAAAPEDAVGGPYVPLDDNVDPATFRASAGAIAVEIDRLAELRRAADGLPLAKPLDNATITSRFGRRVDPFYRRPAMHAGIDFKAPTGVEAKATAGGKVVEAGYAGGYGYMVEIDHGRGVTTRYGHLSRILVKKGQAVSAGDVVGRIGSTGRSTGPHLHYEVRINDRAIDPMRYIAAGTELKPLL